MSNRSKTLYEIPATCPEGSTEEINTIEVEVSYRMGGHNPFTHREQPRGYYLSASPVNIQQHDGYQTRSFMAFSGRAMVLEEANRFSQSKLDKVAASVTHGEINKLLDKIVAKHCLTLNMTEVMG